MRRMLFVVLAAVGTAACGNAPQKVLAEPQPDGVEVLCFHGAKRCAACIAMEHGAKEVVETAFADAVKKGDLRFRIIDLTRSENEAWADRYEVTWSSLLVIKRQDGAETVYNLTQSAFASARSHPAKFRARLKAEIGKLLEE